MTLSRCNDPWASSYVTQIRPCREGRLLPAAQSLLSYEPTMSLPPSIKAVRSQNHLACNHYRCLLCALKRTLHASWNSSTYLQSTSPHGEFCFLHFLSRSSSCFHSQKAEDLTYCFTETANTSWWKRPSSDTPYTYLHIHPHSCFLPSQCPLPPSPSFHCSTGVPRPDEGSRLPVCLRIHPAPWGLFSIDYLLSLLSLPPPSCPLSWLFPSGI